MTYMRFTVAIALLLLIPVYLFAQEGYEHLSPVAHGAGRTYVVTSRGLSAVGLNPALITPDGNATWAISAFSSIGLDKAPSWTSDSLSSLFKPENGNIPLSRRIQLSDLLMNEKMSGRVDAQILGIEHIIEGLGTFAFTWTTHIATRTVLSDDFLNFLKTYEAKITQQNGSYSDFDFQGMWYHEYTLTFGRELFHTSDKEDDFLRSFKGGVALKYVAGTGYIGLDPGSYFNTRFGNGSATVDVNYRIRSAYTSDFDPSNVPTSFSFGFITNNQAGSGFGADIGFEAGFFHNQHGGAVLSIASSITDIGSITWSVNASERVADHLHDTIVYLQASNKDYSSALGKKYGGTLTNVPSFTTSLPTMFRFGSMLDLDGAGMSIPWFASRAVMEYAAGLTDVVGSLAHPRLGFGLALEHSSAIASLRAEAGYFIQSGQSDLTLGVGTTLFDLISIDVSTAHLGDLLSGGRTDVSFVLRAQF